MKRKARWGSVILAAMVTGCPITSSQGVDLGVRGILSLLISRQSGSATAYAGASVRDNTTIWNLLELADDQVISVNGVDLSPTLLALVLGLGIENVQVAAEIGAVNAPESYSITFDNQGEVASMTVTPPTDFTSVTPATGTQVSKTGFTVTWSPTGEADVLVDIVIEGLGPDGEDQDTDPDTEIVTLSNLSDDGTVTIGAGDLSSFLTGTITVSVKRFLTFSQTLGFASGQVRTEVVQQISLTLGN
jgi:hypothetical protein